MMSRLREHDITSHPRLVLITRVSITDTACTDAPIASFLFVTFTFVPERSLLY